MEKLLCAPSELLVKIFELLPASDLVSVAKTCRRFRDVVAIDQIWHDLSQRGELTCIYLPSIIIGMEEEEVQVK